MAKTLCPSCGFSPIPEGAEECPACHEPFAFVPAYKRAKRLDRMAVPLGDDEGAATMMGGTVFTGAISVHPKQAIALFLLGAFAWTLRATGAMQTGEGSRSAFVLVAGALLSALLLSLRRGPSRFVSQITAFAMLVAALLMDLQDMVSVRPLAFAAHGAATLLLVTGEPGKRRRWSGLGFGLIAISVGVTSLAIDAAPRPRNQTQRREELTSNDYGFRLLLPQEFRMLKPSEVTILPAPADGDRTEVTVGSPGVIARLEVVREDVELVGTCQAQYRSIGGRTVPEPTPHPAPAAMGRSPLVYALGSGSGSGGVVGRLACAKLHDGRFVSLVVLSLSGDRPAADKAFAALGEGLRLQ